MPLTQEFVDGDFQSRASGRPQSILYIIEPQTRNVEKHDDEVKEEIYFTVNAALKCGYKLLSATGDLKVCFLVFEKLPSQSFNPYAPQPVPGK